MAHGVPIDGEALKLARLRKGWSMRTLAEEAQKCGEAKVDFGNVSRYEQGSLRPSPPTLKAIADALGLDITDLMVSAGRAA